MSTRRKGTFWETISNRTILLFILAVAILSGFISQRLENRLPWWSSLGQNFATELLGSLFIFLLIDQIIGARERKREREAEERARLKRQLIRQLRSPHAEIAAKAAQKLREYGWFADGSLHGAYLSYANWSNLDMSGIDVEGARMRKVRLVNTKLKGANLEGTTVTVERLALAHSLRGAIMRDGRRYDGRLNLKGDLEEAMQKGINPQSEQEMANFYGVSLEEYQQGQKWAVENLEVVRQRAQRVVQSLGEAWWEKITRDARV